MIECEAELRAVYAAVDAVADDWYAVLADAHACGVCLAREAQL